MNEIEQYEFDRRGYITIKNMLADAEVQSLRQAVDQIGRTRPIQCRFTAPKTQCLGAEYHVNKEKGYHVQGSCAEGKP